MGANWPTATNSDAEATRLTRTVRGLGACIRLDTALRSADLPVLRPDGRPQAETRPLGAIVAEHLAFPDRARWHWTLVLHTGPAELYELVQYMPILDFNEPPPASIPGRITSGQFGSDPPCYKNRVSSWHG